MKSGNILACRRHVADMLATFPAKDPPMPNLPYEAAEMVFEGDDGYQPDCPWKYAADYDQAINDALMDDDLIGGWGENARESSTVANLGVSICNNRVSLGCYLLKKK